MAINFGQVRYHVFKDYNIPFDEKGTTCGTVRLVQWVKEGEEPNIDKAKLELRKIYTSAAEEKTGKGYTFGTENGPNELVEGLIRVGFGNTKQILREVRKREDFLEAANTINDDNDGSDDGEMFDMRDLLLGVENNEDEEAS